MPTEAAKKAGEEIYRDYELAKGYHESAIVFMAEIIDRHFPAVAGSPLTEERTDVPKWIQDASMALIEYIDKCNAEVYETKLWDFNECEIEQIILDHARSAHKPVAVDGERMSDENLGGHHTYILRHIGSSLSGKNSMDKIIDELLRARASEAAKDARIKELEAKLDHEHLQFQNQMLNADVHAMQRDEALTKIATLERTISERDARIALLSQRVAELERHPPYSLMVDSERIAILERTLAERNATIAAMQGAFNRIEAGRCECDGCHDRELLDRELAPFAQGGES